jgi:hypothetical protein
MQEPDYWRFVKLEVPVFIVLQAKQTRRSFLTRHV